MELKSYLTILWRRKWVIIATAVVTILVVTGGTYLITPSYEASATLRISTRDASSDIWGNLQYVERLRNTYALIVTSESVSLGLQKQLGTVETPEISIELPANTELMQVTAKAQDPTLAMQAANTVSEILMGQSGRTKTERNFTISLIDPAIMPDSPTSPSPILNIALGVILGLVGGVGLAFLFENLDTTLYSTQQIETTTQLTTLATIPTARNKKKQPTTFLNGNSPQGEGFRRLRTNLNLPEAKKPLQTIMVASAEAGEGKSTIAANLAYAIAQSNRSVVVIDTDLRLPTLHKIFNLPNQTGLSNVLKHEAGLAEVVQDSHIPGLQVLTSGPQPANPAELLALSEMVNLIEQLSRQYDQILLDTPALLAVTDALVLAKLVDGVILVVGRTQTRQEAVQAACRQLGNVKAPICGVVVNRAEPNQSYNYYYQSKTDQST